MLDSRRLILEPRSRTSCAGIPQGTGSKKK